MQYRRWLRRIGKPGPGTKMVDYLITYTGKRVDLPSPDPASIDIVDIATHLSRIPRFVGGTSHFYSVAQHSVAVAYLSVAVADHHCPPHHLATLITREMLKEGMLHDGHEAYTGDIPGPVKALCRSWKAEVEHPIDGAIRRAFGLAQRVPPHVHTADAMSLLMESNCLRGPGNIDMSRIAQEVKDMVVRLAGSPWFKLAQNTIGQQWDCEVAKDKFLKEWYRIED